MRALLIIFLQFLLHIKNCDCWKRSDLPNDKYISYLQYPHINFRGKFKANVATGNNEPSNYDSENFFAHYHKYRNRYGGKDQWNPDGTNDFILMKCYVSSACHVDGKCTSKPQGDKVCRSKVTDGGLGSFAKIVDIDTAYQLVPEIWGLKIKVPGFFTGDMEATPLTEFWSRQLNTEGDQGKGGIFQSVLKNIVWDEKYNTSTSVMQMKETMEKINSSELSIIFYLDLYNGGENINFSVGRIIGTIGVSGPLSPRHYTWGRSLEPTFTKKEGEQVRKSTEYQYMHRAQFVLNQHQRRLYINFENSLRLNKKGNPVVFPGKVFIGYCKGKDESRENSGIKCARNFTVLGHLPKIRLNSIYWNYGGIISLELSEKQTFALQNRPLAILEIRGKTCKLLMQEPKDGILVKPMNNWVFRLQTGQLVQTKFFVAKFRKPYPNATVVLFLNTAGIVEVSGVGEREKAQVSYVSFKTDKNGIAHAKFSTISSTFQRTGLDGNLEGYAYFVNGSEMGKRASFGDSRLFLHVYHNRSYTEPITWIDHVYPIFRQYANLYPVMSSRTFDMANYFDIIDHKDIMKISLTLPMSHPSYMPATRDLSEPRLKMILSWLNQEKPAFGDVTKVFTKHYLKSLLQIGLEIAHAGLPPMLTALWSIRDKHNGRIKDLINHVAWQDVRKMVLIGNLLEAIGGKPKFLHQGFVPNYLSTLPGGIKRNLILSLEKLSVHSLSNQFLELKRPDCDLVGMLFRKTIFDYVGSKKNKCKCSSKKECKNCNVFTTSNRGYKKCKQVTELLINETKFRDEQGKGYNQYVDPQDRHVFEHHSSFGQFFDHILLTLTHLTDCGVNNTIFTGDASMQIINNGKGRSFGSTFVVHDFTSAVTTIKAVLDTTHSLDDEYQSQYVAIRSVVDETNSLPIIRVKDKLPAMLEEESNHVIKKFREKVNNLKVKRVAVFEKGVWPIASNLKHSDCPRGKIRTASKAFNIMYTMFLRSFELLYKTTNATKRAEYVTTINLMVDAMRTYAEMLVRMPLAKHGNKNIGPNAAPTFEPDFNFLLQEAKRSFKYLKQLAKNNWKLDMFKAMRIKLKEGTSRDEQSMSYAEEDDILIPLAKSPKMDVSKISRSWSNLED